MFQNLKSFPIEEDPCFELEEADLMDMPGFKTVFITKRFNIRRLKRFVVVDTETTGIDPETNRIAQLSAMRFEDGKPTEYWDTYVNPQMPVSKSASDINGLTDEMLKDKPLLKAVTPSFLCFLGKDPIAGYNVEFDLKFLWCSGIDLVSGKELYDAMLSSYGVFTKYDPRLKNRRLTTVAKCYGIEFPAHNSLGDVYATGEVLVRTAETITGKKISRQK